MPRRHRGTEEDEGKPILGECILRVSVAKQRMRCGVKQQGDAGGSPESP